MDFRLLYDVTNLTNKLRTCKTHICTYKYNINLDNWKSKQVAYNQKLFNAKIQNHKKKLASLLEGT